MCVCVCVCVCLYIGDLQSLIVGVLKFKTLCSLIQDKADQSQDDILTHLMKFAVLVQGCWVVRSNLLFPEGFYSAYNSVPHSVMCRARDLIVSRPYCV